MAIQVNKTVSAVVEETTYDELKYPASGSDYVALQSGFTMTPNIESVENEELNDSIAAKAPIITGEAPEASLTHYIRHSGVEGQAPNYGLLLKSAIGEEVAAPAETNTAAGSTAGTDTAAAVVNVVSGAGFQRGSAVLLKESGLIRPVHSVLGNALTLGFNLPSAPTAGFGTGRPVLYKPSDVSPSLSLHYYHGNDGAHEAISGAIVSSAEISVNARELINGSFNFSGITHYFNPIEIDGSTDSIDFDDGAPQLVTLTAGTYRDPNVLAKAIEDAMNSVSSGITVKFNNMGANAGKFTISKASGTLDLNFGSGVNQIASKIGFNATDLTGSLSYTGQNEISYVAPQTPAYDAAEPIVAKNVKLLLGQFNEYECFDGASATITVENTVERTDSYCSGSGYGETLKTQRVVSFTIEATLPKHDAAKYKYMKDGEAVRLALIGGVYLAGKYQAGKSFCIYMPKAKITNHEVAGDTVATLTIEGQAEGEPGVGEFFISYL